MGDLNVDILCKDRPSQRLLSMFNQLGLSQLINEPTRVAKYTSTCLDLIITDIEWISASGVIENGISYHYPIFLARKKERLGKNKKEITCCSFKNFDLVNFQADLAMIDFSLTDYQDVNEVWLKMWSHIVEICDRHCPQVTFIANEKPPFIDVLALG